MSTTLTHEGTTIATLEVADSFFTRLVGLLGRRGLPSGHGILLKPLNAVHTHFMRFPIDILFLDGDSKIVSAFSDVGPWRILRESAACAVVELPAGTIQACGIEVGMTVSIGEGPS